MKRLAFLAILGFSLSALGQQTGVQVPVTDDKGQPLPGATVELRHKKDSSLFKIQVADAAGIVHFPAPPAGNYFFRASRVGYTNLSSASFPLPLNGNLSPLVLKASDASLSGVTVSARRSFVEMKGDKTIVNLEAGITQVGTTALEALEKLPGVTVDRDGAIAYKGRPGVLLLIDGKPTYLGAAELATLLNGMSAEQISQVELMDNPPARYDAAGNAGAINIRLKKNRQRGFNGTFNTAFTQGRYPKTNNSLALNFRQGAWASYFNYSLNFNKNFTRIYALRKYLAADEVTLVSQLEQPSMFRSQGLSHNIRTGTEYTVNNTTSLGLNLTALMLERKGHGNNDGRWMSPSGTTDSVISTEMASNTDWSNLGLNLNLRKTISKNEELSVDADLLGYRIRGDQLFENRLLFPATYIEASRANTPSDIGILSGKADYTGRFGNRELEAGWKSSLITTDNAVAYEVSNGGAWTEDLGRSNRFQYNENIHAFYVSGAQKSGRWNLQGGLRYEWTGYDARQLGNAVVKDSSFSRNYHSLFPSFSAGIEADSSNSFSFSAARRIDRPPFQKLNPFGFIINKYTIQRGNPFFRPQYTWNFELSHSYKNLLLSSVSYSRTDDYFAQFFPIDTGGMVVYTEGNLGVMENLGFSVALNINPVKAWSLNAQAVLNRKHMTGVIGKSYEARITQVTATMNNTFRFSKGWGAELSGTYTSRSQHDIQEVVDPAGQLSIGFSKSVWKNKGTVKLAARDLFYTQWMKGNTYFTRATEYFKLTRDTRVLALSFSWRFGKSAKAARRSEGASREEMQRVGNG